MCYEARTYTFEESLTNLVSLGRMRYLYNRMPSFLCPFTFFDAWYGEEDQRRRREALRSPTRAFDWKVFLRAIALLIDRLDPVAVAEFLTIGELGLDGGFPAGTRAGLLVVLRAFFFLAGVHICADACSLLYRGSMAHGYPLAVNAYILPRGFEVEVTVNEERYQTTQQGGALLFEVAPLAKRRLR